MTWHELKQTTCKNLSGTRGKKHEERSTMWFKASPKLVKTLRRKEKRSFTMKYDFTMPTEDPEAWNSGVGKLSQSAHAEMSARETRNQILVLCRKLFNEDLSLNQVKDILFKRSKNKYKKNNLTGRGN